MQLALASAALLMGLAGGPHCVAMCGAAQAGVIRIVPAGSAGTRTAWSAPASFHLGRMASYAVAGAVAAASVDLLARASIQVGALRPLWVLLHVFVFAWGAMLAIAGRQPLWAQRAGRLLESRLHPLVGASPLGLLAAGALWVAMPCGLLYSALMLAPWLWQRLRGSDSAARQAWGARLAGVLLAAVALQALWSDLSRQIDAWCR